MELSRQKYGNYLTETDLNGSIDETRSNSSTKNAEKGTTTLKELEKVRDEVKSIDSANFVTVIEATIIPQNYSFTLKLIVTILSFNVNKMFLLFLLTALRLQFNL